MKLKNKLIGVFIVLVSIISIRVVKADNDLIGEYFFQKNDLSGTITIKENNELELMVKHKYESNGSFFDEIYENTKVIYFIQENL